MATTRARASSPCVTSSTGRVPTSRWETEEGETNAFAAPGRSGAMVIPQDVLELRAARVKTMRQKRSTRAADK